MSTIIHGDCIDYLRSLPNNAVDLLLTDPPYGIGIAKNGYVGKGTQFAKKAWDAKRPAQEYFQEMLRVSRNQIIWGGNYFADYLPPSRCWLVWYKRDNLPILSFADCELAWTSFDRTAMVFNCRWYGFVKDSREKKVHPTQKALAVMEWCIEEFSHESYTILDPFMGSGSMLVAAKRLGRNYIGVERDIEYLRIAQDRIAAA
jgi:site-specific DNA-methyltransferase (adenine-specific)